MKGSCHFNKKSKRWFISIFWEKKRYTFYKHPQTGEPFWAEKSADKQLNRIRTEIDEGYFNPRCWMPDSPMSIKHYALEWLNVINVAPKTLKDYKSAVKNYIIPFFGDKDLRRVRHTDLVNLHTYIKLSDKGKYNVVATLRTMMRYAWRNEDLLRVPPFPKMSYTRPEIEFLTMEQQESVLDAIPENHRPIFQFMMEYGCRPGEAMALQKDCIVDGEVVIRRAFSENTLREQTKTGKVRRYKITSYFQSALDSMQSHIAPFVFTREDCKPYTSKNLNKIWHEACAKVNVKIKMYNGVRHSLGCQLLDMGYDMDLVREQLGHTKMDMTMRYAKRSKAILSDALEARRGNVVELKIKKVGNR